MSMESSMASFFLSGDAAVVEHQGMQVAVAGMKDVGDAQARGGAHAFDFAQNTWARRCGE